MLVDVNVLVGAMRTDAPRHDIMRACLQSLRESPEPFAITDLVLSGALRVLTHPRVFTPPTPVPLAMAFVDALRATPNALVIAPGSRHWGIYRELVRQTGASGNLLSDAWYAALAIEHGCDILSDDSDFARFPGVRWQRPGEARR